MTEDDTRGPGCPCCGQMSLIGMGLVILIGYTLYYKWRFSMDRFSNPMPGPLPTPHPPLPQPPFPTPQPMPPAPPVPMRALLREVL